MGCQLEEVLLRPDLNGRFSVCRTLLQLPCVPRKERRLQYTVEQRGHSGISSSVFTMVGTRTHSFADGKLLRTLHRQVLHLKQHLKEWTTRTVSQVSNRIWTLSQTKMGASLSDTVMGHSSHTRATEV